MKLIRKVFVLTAICVGIAGCMTVTLVSDGGVPVMMSGVPDRDYTVVRSFEVSHQAWFTLYDLITVNNPGIQKTLDAELKRSGGDAIINVEIVGQTTAIDGLVPIGMTLAGYALGMAIAPDLYTGITYGSAIGSIAGAMLSSRTYTISGDVIRFAK